MEGLAAFFLESTFIGLWIFGKGRLSPRVHLVTIWLVSFGSALSAWFIIAANSWMQNPVGYKPGETPELTDIGAVLFSSTTLWAFSHVLSAALITGALVALAVCAWQLRNGGDGAQFGSGLRLSLTLLCVGLVAAFFFGDALMRDLVTRQPMKVAAAEALFETEGPAALSLFATGDFSANPGKTNREIKIPHLLSLLATLSWDGTVQGVNNVNAQYRKEFGPGEYAPVVAVIYWSFRVMVYTYGALVMFALIGLWLWRKGTLETSRRWLKLGIFAGVTPFLINTAGWVMTEMGRQPWIVQGLLKTEDGVSPRVTTGQVALSLGGFLVLFSLLGSIALWLFLREAKHLEPSDDDAEATATKEERELSLAY